MKTIASWALALTVVLLAAEGALAAAPELDVLSPKEGSTIHPDSKIGAVVVTQFEVKNFKIMDFTKATAVQPGEGHIHIWLDNQPFNTIHTASNVWVFGGVKPGKHAITLQLVNNNHTPVEPKIIKTVHFSMAAK